MQFRARLLVVPLALDTLELPLELGDASVFRGRVGGGLAGAPLKLGDASVLGGEFAPDPEGEPPLGEPAVLEARSEMPEEIATALTAAAPVYSIVILTGRPAAATAAAALWSSTGLSLTATIVPCTMTPLTSACDCASTFLIELRDFERVIPSGPASKT